MYHVVLQVAETPTQLFLILEYADGGDLFDHIVKYGSLKESVARRYFWQILSAVLYMVCTCDDHSNHTA